MTTLMKKYEFDDIKKKNQHEQLHLGNFFLKKSCDNSPKTCFIYRDTIQDKLDTNTTTNKLF